MDEDNIPKKFAPVAISKISSNVVLPTDLYLFISDKYIKFKKKGDQISSEKYSLFVSKNLKIFYIPFKEISIFMEWIKLNRAEVVDDIVAEIGEENREIAEKSEDIQEKIYETLADKEINSENVASLKNDVEIFVSEIVANEQSRQILVALLKVDTSIAEHSANVANMSIFVAMVLGVGRQSQLEHIYMGALFHDYGKAKIPSYILENQKNVLYSQAIQDHPKKGAEMLKKAQNIPAQVIRIVREHHELYNGQGYPGGLKGKEIYELSKIVSMANIIDEEIQRYKIPCPENYLKVAKFIEKDNGKKFDPEDAKKVSQALEISFSQELESPQESI